MAHRKSPRLGQASWVRVVTQKMVVKDRSTLPKASRHLYHRQTHPHYHLNSSTLFSTWIPTRSVNLRTMLLIIIINTNINNIRRSTIINLNPSIHSPRQMSRLHSTVWRRRVCPHQSGSKLHHRLPRNPKRSSNTTTIPRPTIIRLRLPFHHPFRRTFRLNDLRCKRNGYKRSRNPTLQGRKQWRRRYLVRSSPERSFLRKQLIRTHPIK